MAGAAGRERKLRGRIARAATTRERNRAQHDHLGSFYTRVAAVAEAARRRGLAPPPGRVVEVARGLDHRRAPTTREVRVPRSRGGWRTTWSFDLAGLALQVVATWQLRAAASVPAWQYALGGYSTGDVVAAVADDLRCGSRWLAVLDIAQCYPSFDAGRAASALPVPRALALNALTGGRPGTAGDARPCPAVLPARRGTREPGGPFPLPPTARGLAHETRPIPGTRIAQGSAFAPLAVAVLLGDLDADLPEGAKLYGWADNLVVTARTRGDAERARDALADALRRLPLGRLVLRPDGRVRRGDWGADILGYNVRTWRGRVIVRPNRDNMERGERLFREALAREAAGRRRPEAVRRTVRGWAGQFSLWPGSTRWRARREFEALRALRPTPPPRVRRRSVTEPT